MEDLNIELGTPSKNKKTKKSYELLRRDSSNGVEFDLSSIEIHLSQIEM